MKTVDEKELRRLKKKGGVKVKRKLGTGKKKSEPEAKVDAALSGAVDTEPAAPALPPAPAPVVDTKPYAAMAASIAASNASMEKLVTNNTVAIRSFSKKLDEIKPGKAVAYRHTIVRGKDKLIEHVDSIPMEMKK